MARVERSASDPAARRDALASLQRVWANEGYAADLEYLEEVARQAATTHGPVLECGSGLTTLALALLAARRGVQVLTLEHEPAWLAHVQAMARRGGGGAITVCETPLRSYEDFDWYDVSRLELPAEFRLVVCDGPPGTTRGGRYGLLPVMREHLASGAVILLDDAARAGESEVLDRWCREGLQLVELRRTGARAFAVLRNARGPRS